MKISQLTILTVIMVCLNAKCSIIYYSNVLLPAEEVVARSTVAQTTLFSV